MSINLLIIYHLAIVYQLYLLIIYTSLSHVRSRRKNGISDPKQSKSGTLIFMFLLSKKVNTQRMPHWGWEVCLLSHQRQVLRFENRVIKTMQSICERLGLSSQTFQGPDRPFYHTLRSKQCGPESRKCGAQSACYSSLKGNRKKKRFSNSSIAVRLEPACLWVFNLPTAGLDIASQKPIIRHCREGPWPLGKVGRTMRKLETITGRINKGIRYI